MFKGNALFFTLPTNTSGILKAMIKSRVDRKYQNEDHSLNVAWRILKDWIECQLAIVEAELADMAEVFLPYAITKNGNTLYKELQESNNLLQIGNKL